MIRCLISVLFLVVSLTSTAQAGESLYLSAGGKVSVYRIDDATGKLTPIQEVDHRGAGPMGVSQDKQFLYVNGQMAAPDGGRGFVPAIATFRIGKGGKLERVGLAASEISSGYLSVDATGRFLAGNSYGQGKAMIWALEERVFTGRAPQVVDLEKKSHSAVFAPNNRFLLVPATEPNKVFQLRFDEQTGEASPNDPPFATGPTGENDARQPRHLIFHPSKALVYTTNEREQPGVGVWTWNSRRGELKTVQNVVTYPKGFDGVITTADLHMTPNGKFLYVSNRDITDRKARTGQDSIVGFSVNQRNGRLDMIGHFPCEHVPRSFALSESGKFAYVAGQRDDRLGVYRINQKTGALKKVEQIETGARPSWVLCFSPSGK
jgi:6-phosphogluconolactonase